MQKVKFYHETKRYVEIEATEEQAKEFIKMNREMWFQERRKKKFERSMDAMTADKDKNGETQKGVQFKDERASVQEEMEERHTRRERDNLLFALGKAMKILTPEQRRIVQMKFYEGRNETEIGRILGITKQSAQDRVKVILRKLKKVLQK